MADNSAALAKARRHDSHTKRARSRAALDQLIETGAPITFTAVARHADVSVSLLYSDKALASDIAAARDRQRQAGAERAWKLPARSLVSDQSLRAELANSKEQVRQLNDENTLLRQRLARTLGTEADIARGRATAGLLAQLETRATELEANNHQLRRQITDLQAQLQEATDSLNAARDANRDLMGMINR